MVYDYVITKPELDDALAHYGVRGMRWGVRKAIRKGGIMTRRKAKIFGDLDIKRRQATSRSEKKYLKGEMKKAYADVRRAKIIDRGEMLSKRGDKRKAVAGQFAAAGVGGALAYGRARAALRAFKKGSKKDAILNASLAALMAAGSASNLGVGIHQRKKNLAIDAYRKNRR